MSKKPTSEQQAVIDSRAKFLVVIACPGSGKTQTLVNRVNSLPTGQKKLVLAFNKKAQEEFSTRMGSNMEVNVKTFHAYCMGHLKRDATQFGFQFKDPQLIHDSNLSLIAKVFQAPPNLS